MLQSVLYLLGVPPPPPPPSFIFCSPTYIHCLPLSTLSIYPFISKEFINCSVTFRALLSFTFIITIFIVLFCFSSFMYSFSLSLFLSSLFLSSILCGLSFLRCSLTAHSLSEHDPVCALSPPTMQPGINYWCLGKLKEKLSSRKKMV